MASFRTTHIVTKRKLLLLVDSVAYIRENCYQHQLLETLQTEFAVTMLPLRQIVWNPFVRVRNYDLVLSVLKQRTLASNLDAVSKLLDGRPLAIYDQDPWQAYIDDSPTRGCYVEFQQKLNISALMLTTKWWTDYCAERGLPTKFVRMGMLPRYCDAGPAWVQRPIEVGFQGTLHPHRKIFFDELAAMGLKVTVLGSGGYSQYLETLHGIQIYIHTEDAPWLVDGQYIPRNSLWIKDVEVAARGCFAMRNWDEDCAAYGIDELPTISAFHKPSEVLQMVESIRAMPVDDRQHLIEETVATIRRRDDWRTVPDTLSNLN